ncbi:MAG: purine-nucleoside phosphorylase [Clostridia bacterium]|nr:purine-nucleoside phosphorylase [Clostridia bacterium]MCR4905409.1 purine-nucleoside phosphorylase [Clostridiales bacterium]
MPTPHNTANRGDFAKTVLLPGDPLRSQFIAENFLDDARLVNNVRGIQGYTGTYRGIPVSVMASGMGIPSIGIYSYELYHNYGVENIIRVGSAGGMQEEVRLRDLVIGMGACTDSAFAAQFGLRGTFAPIASWELLSAAVEIAKARGFRYHIGNLFSTDAFYAERGEEVTASWKKMGVLAAEMEAAGLYMTAARAGKRALALCTISDHLLTGEETRPEERQTTFTQMIEVALETAFRMENP